MKAKFLRVFSIILIVFGALTVASVADDLAKGIRQDAVLGVVMAICFIFGGVLILRALKHGYRLGWRVWVGAILVFFALVGLGTEVDSMIAGTSEDTVFGFSLVGIFAVSGFLLARSGLARSAPAAEIRERSQPRVTLRRDYRQPWPEVPPEIDSEPVGEVRRPGR